MRGFAIVVACVLHGCIDTAAAQTPPRMDAGLVRDASPRGRHDAGHDGNDAFVSPFIRAAAGQRNDRAAFEQLIHGAGNGEFPEPTPWCMPPEEARNHAANTIGAGAIGSLGGGGLAGASAAPTEWHGCPLAIEYRAMGRGGPELMSGLPLNVPLSNRTRRRTGHPSCCYYVPSGGMPNG